MDPISLQIPVFVREGLDPWGYFWFQLPYGLPGILTFLVGIFLATITFTKLREVEAEQRVFRINLTVSFFSFGMMGILLTVRACIQNVETLVFWNNLLYFFVAPLAPTAFYLAYFITNKRSKSLLYWSYICYAATALMYFGILIGKGFLPVVIEFPFGKFPQGSSFVKPWGIIAPLGYFLFIAPAFFRHRDHLQANYHPALYHGINLLFFLTTLNAPAILGFKLYPGGFFLFIPLLLVAFGVFRSDFLDMNELLFQKNGMFYFLFGLLSFILLSISSGVSLGIAPSVYSGSNWFPYGIPPLVSVFFSIFLSIIVAGANPSSRLNQLSAFALILTGFYGIQSVLLKLNLDYLIQLRISQLNFLIFSFVPSVMFRLLYEALAIPKPKWLRVIDVFCLFCAGLSPSPFLFDGYYEYPWSRIHHGGVVEISIVFMEGIILLTVLYYLIKQRGNLSIASVWIASSFAIMAFFLILATFPAHGIPIYPMSDFQFIPAFILGYSVLKLGALSLEGRTIQLSQKLANLGLFTMFLAGILYFPMIKDEYGYGESAYHLTMVVLPLVLFNYLIVYIMSRPLAEELDISYFLLDLEKQKADEEREKALIMQDKAEESREESEKLLLNILPFKIAQELKVSGSVTPARIEKVSVLFTDFKGFTKVAEKMTENDLIRELDACFTQFDEICSRNNIEKLKTIGDSYMCAGGLPDKNNTNPIDMCLAALEIQAFMNQLKEIKLALNEEFWELRIGIHTGPVVAGVVGRFKFAYDIWGDTVNIASRMESSGSPGQINISKSTYDDVKFFFETEYRGKHYGKNKGDLDMYFLKRLRSQFAVDSEGRVPNQRFRMAYARIQGGAKVRWKNPPPGE